MTNIDDIKKAIETAFEIPFKRVLKGRESEVLFPRYLFTMLALEEGYKPKVIATELGQVHSTVSFAKKTGANLLNHNRTFKDAYLVATKYLEDLD